MTPQVVTDDEVLAISVSSGARWPGHIPTVDTGDVQDIERALLRGQRSLALHERDLDWLVENLGRAATSPRRLVTYVGNEELEQALALECAAFYEVEGRFLAETVTAVGVHAYELLERQALVATLGETLTRTLHGGESTPEDDLWVCVGRFGAEDGEVLAVRPGEVRLADIRAEEPYVVSKPEEEPQTVVDAFLGRAGLSA